MRYVFLMIIGVINLVGFSQTITVDSSRTNFYPNNLDEFYYVHPDFDTTAHIWVANITCHFDTLDYDCGVNKIYRLLEIEGNKLGGNGFKVRGSDLFSKHKFVSLSIYKIRNAGSWKKKNYFNLPNNKAYIIGDCFYHNPKYKPKLEIYGKSIVLDRCSYIELDFPKGSDLSITVSFKRKKSSFVIDHSSDEIKDKDLILFYIIQPYINKSFSPLSLDWTYGQFLVQILKKQTF